MSKNPQLKVGEDPLPSFAPDASSSLLSTDLNLAPSREQASSTKQHRQASPSVPQVQAQAPSPQQGSMAYQRADPVSFLPFGFHAMEVQHRAIMSHAVVHHQQPTHDDYVIIGIHPLPAHTMHFVAVHEVVLEFQEEHMHIRVRNIQPSHLG
jgi:hypothetical protein